MLATIAAAAACIVLSWRTPVSARDVTHGILWASLSITYSTLARHIETVRRALVADPAPNLIGVWTFAAALDLALPIALAVTVLAYLAQWPARRAADRRRAIAPHRYVYSTAVMVLAVTAAHTARGATLPQHVDLVVAFMALIAVNITGVAVPLALTQPERLRALASPFHHAVQAATYLIGAGAVGLVDLGAPVAGSSLLAALAVQQVATRRELLNPRNIDWPTRVLRERAWLDVASARAADYPSTGLVLVDARVQDIGLAARIILAECRSATTDHVGRCGDGLAVALPGVNTTVAMQVGYRLQRLLRQANVDASVAAAACPADAPTILGAVSLLDAALLLRKTAAAAAA